MSRLSDSISAKVGRFRRQRSLSAIERRVSNRLTTGVWWPTFHEGSSVLDLKGDHYFSCAVSRKLSTARYLLGSSSDVVTLIKELAWGSDPS